MTTGKKWDCDGKTDGTIINLVYTLLAEKPEVTLTFSNYCQCALEQDTELHEVPVSTVVYCHHQ